MPFRGGGVASLSEITTRDHDLLTGLLDDDHTQYRLESEDHTHQSTGLQAGLLDHGLALTGFLDDDHTQYALLAGRAGGQTLIGGTAASEEIRINSTSHATKGIIRLGAGSNWLWDESSLQGTFLGNLAVGPGGSAILTNTGLRLRSSNTGLNYGIRSELIVSTNRNAYGLEFSCTTQTATHTGEMMSIRALVQSQAGGAYTIQDYYGVFSGPGTWGGTGTITRAYHFYATNTANTVTQYGLYIEDLSSGSTNNYGVYFAGTSGLARQGVWWNADTNIYRSAANVLTTDDELTVLGSNLGLAGATSDPASPTDGDVWYRTDLDEFRGRANGITYKFVMQAI